MAELSVGAPVGRALLGQVGGDTVVVETPRGHRQASAGAAHHLPVLTSIVVASSCRSRRRAVGVGHLAADPSLPPLGNGADPPRNRGLGPMAAAIASKDASRYVQPQEIPHGGRGAMPMKHAPDRTVTWRLIATIGAVALVALATSPVANATTKITVDSGWQSNRY